MSDEEEGPFLRVLSASKIKVTELPPRSPRQIADGVKVVPESDIDVALRNVEIAVKAAELAGVPSAKTAVAELNQAWCAEVEALHIQLARVLGYELDQGEELPSWGELLRVAEANTDLAFHTRMAHELAREQTDD